MASVRERQYSRGNWNRGPPTSSNETDFVRQFAEKEVYTAYKICMHSRMHAHSQTVIDF
jgi:hypothetical protein